MPISPRKPLRRAIEIQAPSARIDHETLDEGEEAKKVSRIFGLLLGALLLALVSGCASDGSAHRPAGHRWYQGDMDNSERAFFLDSFSDRN